jgi:hypothetical protein
MCEAVIYLSSLFGSRSTLKLSVRDKDTIIIQAAEFLFLTPYGLL